MQAQANLASTQAITQTQSLAAVQTLLRAGLSCITFLRNLLPEENFAESHLTTADDSIISSSDADATPMNKTRSNKVNGFRIMTMVRGYTDEADRILNYLENGIFDALEKQYLRSFIFAIYLDSKDPKNIVEAYTFNFKYHKIPGTDTMAPVMTLGNDLENMSLNGSSHRPKDPVAEAVHQGRLPTLREVKKSVKTMMKTLIQAITHMDELPRRRFATFKLFYTDATPDDYEPPNFNTGDFEKDRWYFMTHNLDEVPDKFSVGKVDCGFHSVNLKVASVASFLPSSTDNDDALFTGTVTKALLPTKLNTEEDTAAFQKQAEDQEEDAKTRNLAWSAEEDLDDVDAEGEDDPDYIQRPDGTYELVSGKGLQESVPLGRRKENGDIEKTIVPDTGSIEACFQGFQESVPTRLQDLNSKPSPEIGLFDETQALFQTEPYGTTADGPPLRLETPADHISGDEKASLPPSNMAMELDSPLSSALTTPSPSLPRRSNGRSPRLANEDEEMLDPETQVGDPNSRIVDAIQSFSPSDKAAMDSKLDAILEPPVTPKTPQPVEDIGLDCSCGITIEDPMCFCEAGCGRWYHVWCMGYHSARDPRLPNKFTCFDCRLRADPSFKYIIEDTVYPSIMEKYREIVTFRRAVKVFEESGSMTQSEFAKSMDGDINSARWYIQRLQEEEFIHQVATTIDAFGVVTETRLNNNRKAKDRKAKQRKKLQRTRYVFNHGVKREQKYKDYFNPDQEVESRMVGLDDLRNFTSTTAHVSAAALAGNIRSGPSTAANPAYDTQTMEFSQELGFSDSQKRGAADGAQNGAVDRPLKKLKISVATGIDLAE